MIAAIIVAVWLAGAIVVFVIDRKMEVPVDETMVDSLFWPVALPAPSVYQVAIGLIVFVECLFVRHSSSP